MPITLELTIEPEGTAKGRIDDLVIAGWTGRNVEALEKHIAELEELGVPRPSSVPQFSIASVQRISPMEKTSSFWERHRLGSRIVLIGTTKVCNRRIRPHGSGSRDVFRPGLKADVPKTGLEIGFGVMRMSSITSTICCCAAGPPRTVKNSVSGRRRHRDASAGRTDRPLPAWRDRPARRHGHVLRHTGCHRRYQARRPFRR